MEEKLDKKNGGKKKSKNKGKKRKVKIGSRPGESMSPL